VTNDVFCDKVIIDDKQAALDALQFRNWESKPWVSYRRCWELYSFKTLRFMLCSNYVQQTNARA
jgi:hypothetical protein